jgi:hypothetical protein
LYVALSFGRFCKSIPARKPQRVAEILAKLMNGKCFPLSPVGGASMAASGDANSTLFEVYLERTTLNMPHGDDQAVFAENPGAPLAAWREHFLLTGACSWL